MCGRYVLFTSEEYEEIRAIIKEIEANDVSNFNLMKTREIFPTDTVPVITMNVDNNRSVDLFKWGFPNFKQNSGVIINARGETIEEKPTFKKILYTKRCLIPACGFFEWKKSDKKKNKYLIKPENYNFFYMAGLYNSFIDKSGNPYTGFVIITTEANNEMSNIHNRMPLLITSKDKAYEWIDKSISLPNIKSFIRPYMNKLSFENLSSQLQFKI